MTGQTSEGVGCLPDLLALAYGVAGQGEAGSRRQAPARQPCQESQHARQPQDRVSGGCV